MKGKNITKLAEIIADHVSVSSEVSFESIDAGSLCHHIAQSRKVTCNKSLRSSLKALWAKGVLRETVEKLLHAKCTTLPTKPTPIANKNIVRVDNRCFELASVIGDGNCLFRALSMGMYNTENCHSQLRQQIVDYVVENFDKHLDTLISCCVEIQYKDADDYKKQMGKDRTYGTDFEIGIFSNLFKKKVNIYNFQNEKYVTIGKISPDGGDEIDDYIHLLFSGDKRKGHFDFLREIEEKEKPANKSEDMYNFSENEDNLEIEKYRSTLCRYNSESNIILPTVSLSEEDTKENSAQRTTDSSYLSSTKFEDHIPTRSGSEGDTEYLVDNSCIPQESVEDLELENGNNIINIIKSEKEITEGDNTIEEKKKQENVPQNEGVKKKKPSYSMKNGFIEVLTSKVSTDDGYINVPEIKYAIHYLMEQEIKASCPLSFYGNIRRNDSSWVMYAYCRVASHSASFRFDIYEVNEHTMRIFISSNTILPYKHHDNDVKACRPVRGNQRKKLLQLLLYRPAREIQLEQIKICDTELVADGHLQNVQNLQVYNKIKSEGTCAERKRLKSRDVEDIIQSYIDDSTKDDPFIRQVSFPLQILLYTKAQLDVLDTAKPIILHLDSTGANVSKPDFLKKDIIFYYCLIYRATHSCIPVAEMITSQHDVISISVFLKKYRGFIMKELNMWPLINAVVMDWSWALMNSVVSTWNDMTMEKYLVVCYNYLQENVIPTNITVLLSCCAHIMHRVSRTIKKDYPELVGIKTFLMECMSMLILCRSFDEMNMLYRDVLEVLLTRSDISMKTAFDYLTCVRNKNSEEVRNMSDESDILKEKERELGDEFIRLYGKNKSVYANSPFYNHFWLKFAKASDVLRKKEEDLKETTNKYYAPQFAEYLTKTFMPYCPLWSGVMFELVDPTISRVSNAYVESHNKSYKLHVLKGQKLNTIGDVCRRLKKNNEYLVAENQLKGTKTKGNIKMEAQPLYPEAADNPFEMETWGRTKKEIKAQKPKRRKYFTHMEGRELIRISRKLKKEEKKQEQEKTTRERRNVKIEASKKKIKKQNQCRVKRENIESKKLSTGKNVILDNLNNGLVGDCLYYFLSNSKHIKISSYTANEFCVIFKKFQLTASNFRCLASKNSWIDGEVVDAYVTTTMDRWRDNVTYFPTDIGGTVLGDFWQKRHDKGMKLMKVEDELKETLLFPYCYQGHWRLLMIRPAIGNIVLMDPYKRSSDLKRVLEAWDKYTHECNNDSSVSKLKKITWTVEDCNIRPFQSISDTSNCALYVMHYIECIGLSINYDLEFNPEKFRENVAKTLLIKSENVKDKCLHCIGNILKKNNTIQCSTCKRWLHEKCIVDNEIDSEEEGNRMRLKPPKRKKQEEYVAGNGCFKCRLCKKYIKKTKNQ